MQDRKCSGGTPCPSAAAVLAHEPGIGVAGCSRGSHAGALPGFEHCAAASGCHSGELLRGQETGRNCRNIGITDDKACLMPLAQWAE